MRQSTNNIKIWRGGLGGGGGSVGWLLPLFGSRCWRQHQGLFFFKTLHQVRIVLPFSAMLSSMSPSLPFHPTLSCLLLLLSPAAPRMGGSSRAALVRLQGQFGSAQDSSSIRWVPPSCPLGVPCQPGSRLREGWGELETMGIAAALGRGEGEWEGGEGAAEPVGQWRGWWGFAGKILPWLKKTQTSPAATLVGDLFVLVVGGESWERGCSHLRRACCCSHTSLYKIQDLPMKICSPESPFMRTVDRFVLRCSTSLFPRRVTDTLTVPKSLVLLAGITHVRKIKHVLTCVSVLGLHFSAASCQIWPQFAIWGAFRMSTCKRHVDMSLMSKWGLTQILYLVPPLIYCSAVTEWWIRCPFLYRITMK